MFRNLKNASSFQFCETGNGTTSEDYRSETMNKEEMREYLKNRLSDFMSVFYSGVWNNIYNEDQFLLDIMLYKEEILKTRMLPNCCCRMAYFEPDMGLVLNLLKDNVENRPSSSVESFYSLVENEKFFDSDSIVLKNFETSLDNVIDHLFEGNVIAHWEGASCFQMWLTTPEEENECQRYATELINHMENDVQQGLYEDIIDHPLYNDYNSIGSLPLVQIDSLAE